MNMSALRPLALAAVAAIGGLVLPASLAFSAIDFHADERAGAPVPRVWAAIAGADTPSVISMVSRQEAQGATDQLTPDEPYCDQSKTLTRTLAEDFAERLVQTRSKSPAGTELWGSDLMGTWTLVYQRQDGVACVIASGTGYSGAVNPALYYTQAGIAG